MISALVKLGLENIWKQLGWNTFIYLDHNMYDSWIGNLLNIPFASGLGIEAIQDFVSGSGKNSMVSESRFRDIMSHEPGGTSAENAFHWEAIIRAKNFV